MLEKQDQLIAFELAQSALIQNKKILYLCSSDKEARLLKNELLLFLDQSEIGYYPEREILPYDRFSTADSIVQLRAQLLNSDKSKIKIAITSCLNIFEKLPPKSFFTSRKQFSKGDSLSIKDLSLSLEELNYVRTEKVYNISEQIINRLVVSLSN